MQPSIIAEIDAAKLTYVGVSYHSPYVIASDIAPQIWRP